MTDLSKWKIVPVEATDDIHDAIGISDFETYDECWKSLLVAAPPTPEITIVEVAELEKLREANRRLALGLQAVIDSPCSSWRYEAPAAIMHMKNEARKVLKEIDNG